MLADYDLDINSEASNLDFEISKYLENAKILFEKRIKISATHSLAKKPFELAPTDRKLKTLMKNIMLFENNEINTSLIAAKTRAFCDEIVSAFFTLENLKLGSVNERKNTRNNRMVKYFTRFHPDNFNINPELTENLHSLNIKITEYNKTYRKGKIYLLNLKINKKL